MPSVRTLGITGGIGSGKSTVCAFLKDMGAQIFEADLEARKLMNGQLRAAIIHAFGPASYNLDGSLNRAWLADQVFSNEYNLNKLNAIVHPGVLQIFENWKHRMCNNGLLIHEAALIYEAGLENHLDAVCVISAPKNVRITRVKKRDGMDENAVYARMSKQLPQEKTECRADVVLVNAEGLAELRRKTRELYTLATDGKTLSSLTFEAHRRL